MPHPLAAATREPRAPAAAKPKVPVIVFKRMTYLEGELETLHTSMESIRNRIKGAQNLIGIDPDHGGSAEILRTLATKRVEMVSRIDALTKLRNEATDWLARVERQRFGPPTDARPKGRIPEGEAALKESIAALRQEIAQAKVGLMEAERAGTKVVNLSSQVRQYVLSLAARGKPPICQITARGQIEISFKEGGEVLQEPDCYVAWLDPEKMIERLLAEFTERQAQSGRELLTTTEREERIAELTTKLDAAERREVLLVDVALDQGISGIGFRADSDPAAFLGVRSPREPAKWVDVTKLK